ncbi:MAG: hypothetical protein CMN01_02125 [Rickettsiales bacterium]|nr:hypothetical protein [Rickettsiales bacterium]
MVKQVKLTAIIEANDNAVFDDSSINQSVGLLGSVKSFEVSLDEEESTSNEQFDSNSTQNSSELVNFIKESNKIYFGTLTIEQRKSIGITVLHVANLEKIRNDDAFKSKFISICSQKFSLNESSVSNILSNTNDDALFSEIRSKFLEGDLSQMFVYIWEMILSVGEEDDLEIELVENTAEKYGFEKPIISETKKLGNDRAKVTKAIEIIDSGDVAYNKLKAFEKTVLVSLLLTECSTIDGKISQDDLKLLKNLLNFQFNFSSNSLTVVLEKNLGYSLTKKVEQVEVYREKYELVEFLWERILSTEDDVNDGEMGLIRKMIRRLDISDVESEGARKEVEQNLSTN